MIDAQKDCPCGSLSIYEDCCGQYHSKLHKPDHPERLMRARYSAFALGLADYIIDTTHRNNPHYQRNKPAWRRELLDYFKKTVFKKLEVEQSSAEGSQGTVSFNAYFTQDGNGCKLHEDSVFKLVNDSWFYYAGKASISAWEVTPA